MNWLQKIAQADLSWIESKSMPLPVVTPEDEKRQHAGIDRMDQRMTQETANELRRQYPNLEYGGAGAIGLALQAGPNEMLKITHDWSEANTATQAFENPVNWVVSVLAPPEMIQEQPPMWAIRMKKLEPLDVEMALFASRLGDLHNTDQYPDPRRVQHLILMAGIEDRQDEAMAIYAQMKYLLDQNRQSSQVWLDDVHGGNVGWDDDGNLKAYDLGPGVFVE